MNKTVLIIGGYGVFGGYLAEALSKLQTFDVIVAGRNFEKAQTFCQVHPCKPLRLDIEATNSSDIIKKQAPFIIVDAAGPFQKYTDRPYKVAEVAIECGAHYLDFSDDAAFTVGIQALDAKAKTAGLTLLSGVSSVPAISSSIASMLARTMIKIECIESVILPGNRAPRGHSVIRAILSQAGQPLKVWRGGEFTAESGWGSLVRIDLSTNDGSKVENRWASLIGAPDLILFPSYFKARSVIFRAGLELKIVHVGLTALAWLVQAKVLRNLAPATALLKWIADPLKRLGSDAGGMRVSVTGQTSKGTQETHQWTVIAKNGDGPRIPAIPAQILCRKLMLGSVHSGARPCLNEFTDHEVHEALSGLNTSFGKTQQEHVTLFQRIIGDQYSLLPEKLQDLHEVVDLRIWRGHATVTRGRRFLARLVGRFAGFPAAGEHIPVTVEMQRTGHGEVWTRTFGDKRFRSYLSDVRQRDISQLKERFGLMTFTIGLKVEGERLVFPVAGAHLLGIPIPRFLWPRSDTVEFVDHNGRACFNVRISIPGIGLVVHYRGWLEPQ